MHLSVHRSVGSISDRRLLRDASERTERAITCVTRAGDTPLRSLVICCHSAAVKRLGGSAVEHVLRLCTVGGTPVGVVEALVVSYNVERVNHK